MIKIGITGQTGFIGSHLYNTLKMFNETFFIVEYERKFFNDKDLLDRFVKECDVVIHLAALNRHFSELFLHETNISLINSLIDSMERTGAKPHIIISSSTQENLDNLYGRSKKESRLLLEKWCVTNNSTMTGLVIPNVYGAFCKPNYNSVVSTFCHKLTHDEQPEIKVDNSLKLIYIDNLIEFIINKIKSRIHEPICIVPHDYELKVSELLQILNSFKNQYFVDGVIPNLENNFLLNLFNTFRSYISLDDYFPVTYKKNIDNRGAFVEIIRLNNGGQISFSTTAPSVTRGNHFHTRKIERFSVIQGEALIQLRKIGSEKIYNFSLSGAKPSYVDMPIWYTHNIKNIGEVELLTIFWINEFYNPEDTDTYFQEV